MRKAKQKANLAIVSQYLQEQSQEYHALSSVSQQDFEQSQSGQLQEQIQSEEHLSQELKPKKKPKVRFSNKQSQILQQAQGESQSKKVKTKPVKKSKYINKKTKTYECPFCNKKDKNIFRLREHAQKCMRGPSFEVLNAQIGFLQKQKKIGMKICRYCEKVYSSIKKYQNHVQICAKRPDKSIYDLIQPNVLPKNKNRTSLQKATTGWVVCPYCTRNIRTSLALAQHLYEECIKNPRNIQKFKENMDKIQRFPDNKSQQNSFLRQLKQKLFPTQSNDPDREIEIEIQEQIEYEDQIEEQVEQEQQLMTAKQQQIHTKIQKKNSSIVRRRAKSLLKMQRMQTAFYAIQKNKQSMLQKYKLLTIQKALLYNYKLFIQSIKDKLKEVYGQQVIQNMSEIQLQAIITQALANYDVQKSATGSIQQKIKKEKYPSHIQLELEDSSDSGIYPGRKKKAKQAKKGKRGRSKP